MHTLFIELVAPPPSMRWSAQSLLKEILLIVIQKQKMKRSWRFKGVWSNQMFPLRLHFLSSAVERLGL